jgi:hypothetical protein
MIASAEANGPTTDEFVDPLSWAESINPRLIIQGASLLNNVSSSADQLPFPIHPATDPSAARPVT